MKNRNIHVCSFSGGLDGLPKHAHKSLYRVLKVIQGNGRQSTFDCTVDRPMCQTMQDLTDLKLLVDSGKEEYPWHDFSVTKRGTEYLEAIEMRA